MSWEWAMRLALAEADRCAETGDVPVGAVIVRSEVSSSPSGSWSGSEYGSWFGVVAAGRNEREHTSDPTAHAEVVAIRRAGEALGRWRLTGCTLVVTLEPCTMCAGALVAARVDRVVFGATDPKAGAAGSLWDVVRDRRLHHRPEVLGGVLAGECSRRLAEFFAARRLG